MASKTINDRDDFTVTISADVGGARSGVVSIQTTGGFIEATTVGPTGSGAEVIFSTVGTAGERAGFLAIVLALRTAARTAKGYA